MASHVYRSHIFIDRPSDFEGFRTVIGKQPSTYRELEQLVNEHIYSYSPSTKYDYLGAVEPISDDESKELLNDKTLVMYTGQSVSEIAYTCDVHTFSRDFPSYPQRHEVYFDRNLHIIGYTSAWLIDK